MISKKILSVLAIGCLLFTSVGTFAQNTAPQATVSAGREQLRNTRATVQVERQGAREERQEFNHERCELWTRRIDAATEQYKTVYEQHKTTYAETKSTINAVIVALEEKGVDVSLLQDDLDEFDDLIVEAAENYEVLMATLQEATQHTCGDGSGDFIAVMRKVRQDFLSFRSSVFDIHLFYRDVLREDILDLKEEL